MASALKESKETPFPSCSNHRKEVGKRASHPRDKDRAEYPHLEALVDFIIYLNVLHVVGQLHRENKATPVSTILVCLIVVGGQRLRPQIWGASLPGIHISG